MAPNSVPSVVVAYAIDAAVRDENPEFFDVRFVCWRRADVWDRIMEALAAAHDTAAQLIDTSIVRVHLHAVVDANGLPVRLGLSPGEAHDNRLCPVFLAGLHPKTMVLGDGGYDADWIRALVNEQGAWANIPPLATRL